MRGAPRMAMAPQNVEPCLRPCHQAGRSRVELELQLLEDQSDRVSRVLGLEFGPAATDPGIGIPAPFAPTCIARDSGYIYHMPVNVRQHGADAPLAEPPLGRLPWALLHHPRFEPLTDQLQHPPIADPSGYQAPP